MDTPKVSQGKTDVTGSVPPENGKLQPPDAEKTRARTSSQRDVVAEDTTPSKKFRPILPKVGLSALTVEAPLSSAEKKKLQNRITSQKKRDSQKKKIEEMEKKLEELKGNNEALENENRELKEKVQRLERENEGIKSSEADSCLTKKQH